METTPVSSTNDVEGVEHQGFSGSGDDFGWIFTEQDPVSSPTYPGNTSSPDGQNNHHPKGFFGRISATFKRGTAAIREWRSLQKQIQVISVNIAKNEWNVQEGLNEYRLVSTSVSFMPQKLDQEIWSLYDDLWKYTPVIKEKTKRVPLFLRRRRTLREIFSTWDALFNQQQSLLNTLSKAPKSVDFYNRIHLARIKKREQDFRDAEIAQRNAQAKESIEKVLSGLIQTNPQGEIRAINSGILRLQDAQSFWRSRLEEISNLETSRTMDPDEIIQIYRNLEDSLRDAPHMAEQVKEVEVQFIRMMTMHEELNSFGKTIVPAEELARILLVVQDEIPKLWASGEWDKLRRALSEVSSFIKFYELPVRSELSLAERRKPGLTRALLAGAGNLPLSQITPVVRGLVSAIDARDKFMSGHSDAVAKLTVQIARRMNWSGEDLEYLEIAALLHDVGKIMVPENILTKLDPLSPDDWKALQAHPILGAQIIKPIEPLSKIAPWIYSHQERWDGAGYPEQISDLSIPAAARIIAVGEAFTVMTTAQPNRQALSSDQAISEITRGAGTQFDPEVAGALIQTVESSGHTSAPSNR